MEFGADFDAKLDASWCREHSRNRSYTKLERVVSLWIEMCVSDTRGKTMDLITIFSQIFKNKKNWENIYTNVERTKILCMNTREIEIAYSRRALCRQLLMTMDISMRDYPKWRCGASKRAVRVVARSLRLYLRISRMISSAYHMIWMKRAYSNAIKSCPRRQVKFTANVTSKHFSRYCESTLSFSLLSSR